MRKFMLPVLCAGFLAASCRPAEQESKTDSSISHDSASSGRKDLGVTPEYFNHEKTALARDFIDSAFAFFSSEISEDHFVLFIPKGLITETKVILRVTTKEGKLIYENIFSTRNLVNGYSTTEIKSDAAMEKYVLEEAKEILQDGFIDPRKLNKEDFLLQSAEADFENYAAFTEIKNSSRVIFHYRLNEESHFYLGYSQEEEQVVALIHCC